MNNLKVSLFKLLFVSILLILTISSFAQGTTSRLHNFTGVVKDKDGVELEGVTIFDKGSKSNGTMSDAKGAFSLSVPVGTTVEFSYMGYEKQEIKVTDLHKPIVVTMQEKSVGLNEVVVVGYGVQKKVNLSGSVETMSAKLIKDRPIVNVGQALQGAIGNLNISVGNGSSNASPSYNIRGYNSINSVDPMVIIDGIVSDESSLNNLNPSDIESVSVLKDASSAAIYGSRAAYGVILITTKTGNNDKIEITYDNNFVSKTATYRPQIVKDPYQNMSYLNQMGSFQFPQVVIDYAKQVSENPTLPKYIEVNGEWTYLESTNWFDEIFKHTKYTSQHSIEASGKTQKTSFLLSGSYFNDSGMIRYASENYNRYNMRSKVEYKVADWLSVGNNTSFMQNKYDRPSAFGDLFLYYPQTMGTYEALHNPEGGWSSAGAQTIGNLIDGGRAETTNNEINTVFDFKADILKNILSVQGDFSYMYNIEYYKTASFPVDYKTGPALAYTWGTSSSAQKVNRPSNQSYVDIFATFNKTLFKKNAINAVLGFSQESYRSEYQWYERQDLLSPTLPTVQLADGDISLNESVSKWAMRSGFGRFNYIFDNKYIAEFDGRYDGSSRFPKGHRYVFNPSGSLAWIVSRENFFRGLNSVVSYLKLRASYGQLANQSTSNFGYLPTMSTSRLGMVLDGVNPITVSTPGIVSGNYTWEKVVTKNLGIDINFLSNRLSFTGDTYIRDTNGMLVSSATYPGVLGTSAPKLNSGSLRTKGFELSVGWKDNVLLANKPLNYSAKFILSDNQCTITKYKNETGSLSDYNVGHKIGEIWGLVTEGYFVNEADVKNHANQNSVIVSESLPGDLKFKDLNGDHVINSGSWTLKDHGDYKIIGNSQSRYNYSLLLGADWNGFDLSAFFQGVGKRQFYPTSSGMNVDYEFYSYFATQWTHLTPELMNNHWTENNPNAYYPRLKASAAATSGKELAATQTKYLLNGAYLRFKNLTLGYTVPQNISSKVLINRLRVYFTAENLFTWDKLPKFYKVDPELAGNTSNGGGVAYSLERSLAFGLNITF
jgi:TonB-linked SusC/RagA family outer membrane protein